MGSPLGLGHKLLFVQGESNMVKRIMASLLYFIIFIALVSCRSDTTIKSGKYISEDGLSWVEIKDDNQYSFNRHIGTSYVPTGNYMIEDDKLVLYDDEEKRLFDFTFDGNKLIFKSGELAEGLIEKDTAFTYGDEKEQLWDYRPMISFGESLYFDTGKAREQISEEWVQIEEIKETCSLMKPMKTGADHYIANSFAIGTKIYERVQDSDTIYVEYNGKFIEYVLQDK